MPNTEIARNCDLPVTWPGLAGGRPNRSLFSGKSREPQSMLLGDRRHRLARSTTRADAPERPQRHQTEPIVSVRSPRAPIRQPRENGFGQRSAQRQSRNEKAESRQEEAAGAGAGLPACARQIEITGPIPDSAATRPSRPGPWRKSNMPTWRRVRSGEFFHAKAKWYRDMAGREVGEDKERMLATARDFDARGRDRDARAAAAVGLDKTVQRRVARGGCA